MIGGIEMAFVRTVSEQDATGRVKELYDADIGAMGYVPNYTKVLSLRPEILVAYRALGRAIRSGMDVRRYELVTVAVAARLRCSY